MPQQNVSTPAGVIALTYNDLVNAPQYAAYGAGASQFIQAEGAAQFATYDGSFAYYGDTYLETPVSLITGPGNYYNYPGYYFYNGNYGYPTSDLILVANNASINLSNYYYQLATTVLAGTGGITFDGYGQNTVIAGGGGNNIELSGTSGAAYLNSGRNEVTASATNAVISAGTGNNLINLDYGSNQVYTTGSDTVIAGSFSGDTVDVVGFAGGAPTGSDLILGGGSQIQFVNGDAASTVYGQSGGMDTVYGGAGGGVFVGGAQGRNTLVAQQGAATLYGGGNGDSLFAGGAARDVLVAGSGNETLTGAGATGNDLFYAGTGPDQITGGSGNDTLVAGGSPATMTGGAGADVFLLTYGQTGGSNNPITITDFNPGQGDRVDLIGYSAAAGSTAAATALANPTYFANGAEQITLTDGTRIIFDGVTNIPSSAFT